MVRIVCLMPSILEKIRILGADSKYDICASTACSRSQIAPNLYGKTSNSLGVSASAGICHSYTPDGRCVTLFKVLYTNACIYSCRYCASQVCKKRMSFTPEELSQVFVKLYSMNVLEGLFLSSGVCGSADASTEQMLQVIKLLRFKYRFNGYIHFKCLPGVSYSLLKEAVPLVDRISINLEAPTKEYLAEIAEQKDFNNDILTRQRWLKEIRYRVNQSLQKQSEEQLISKPIVNKIAKEWEDEWGVVRRSTGYAKVRWDQTPVFNCGQTTQMVLGPGDESDYDYLKRSDFEYREMDLNRVYYSAFCPVKGTPLESKKAAPLEREHRLYQADWLLRIYHYSIRDLKSILTPEENLPNGDPKVHLAAQYFADKGPVDPNRANYQELLRVPGIGPQSARRILQLQKGHHQIKSRQQLQAMGVVIKRADPFLKVSGSSQSTLLQFLNKVKSV